MKKLNLLLATTAILSAGALMVNADVGDQTVVPVRAELIHVHNLHATPIDFGRIGVDDGEFDAGTNVQVNLDSAGIVTYDESSDIPGYILSNGKKGSVTGTDCEHLDIGSAATMVNMSLPNPYYEVNVDAVAVINCITVDGNATFYGRFMLSMLGDGIVPAGNYTGNLTVTEINPEP